MRSSLAPAALALFLAAGVRAQSAKQAGQNAAVSATGSAVNRIAAQPFEQGVSIATNGYWNDPASGARSFDQQVSVSWKPLPNTPRYRIQRAGAATGPWFSVHDVQGTTDQLTGLPPAASFYVRVLALRDGGRPGYVVADSSMPVSARTSKINYAYGGEFVTSLSCTAQSGNKVAFHWHPYSGATGYVITPYGVPAGSQGQVNSSAANPQPAIVVNDTTFTYTLPMVGRMVIRVQARADFANWPGPGQTYTVLTPMPADAMATGWRAVTLDAAGSHCN